MLYSIIDLLDEVRVERMQLSTEDRPSLSSRLRIFHYIGCPITITLAKMSSDLSENKI